MNEPICPRAGTGCIEYDDVLVKTPALIEKKDGKPSTASRIYLPAEWAGKPVICMMVNDKKMRVPIFSTTPAAADEEANNQSANTDDKKKSD